MDSFLKDILKNEQFIKIIPAEYAKQLKTDFANDKQKWYNVISPAKKADELIVATNNDYSQIWDDYCACCFKPIDKYTTEEYYVTSDKLTWLCKDCYQSLFTLSKTNN